jgi:hypothetical protein
MSDETPLEHRYYRCTFRHTAHRTEHVVIVAVPHYSEQDMLSSSEGFAWRQAERAIEEEQGTRGVWLHDLFRMRITRITREETGG